VDRGAVGPRELGGPRHDRIQYRLQVEGRADRPTDFSQGLQFVHRSAQFTRPCLQLGEQPHVLDGDHRLVGEGLEERDLLRRERPWLDTSNVDRANNTALAEHWHP
jgi:hypothetical protein